MLRTLVAVGSAMLLGVAVLVPTGLPASASPDREEVEQEQERVQQGLEQSRDSLEHVSAELIAASERLSDLQGQLPGARQEVATAQSDAEAARQRDVELAAELELAEAAVVAAGLQLEERTAEADETEKVVAGVAREVYQGAGFSSLTLIFDAGSAREYTDMAAFAAVARRSQEQALSRLRVQQSEILNAEARLDAERARVDDLKARAAEQVLMTQAAEQIARDAQARLEGLVRDEDEAVAAFAAAKAADEAQIAGLEQDSQRLEVQLAAIAEAERLAELERQRLAELERQRQIEAERLRQAEAERLRQAEVERLRQAEVERLRQAEVERLRQAEVERREAARNNRPPPPPPPPPPAPAPPAPPPPVERNDPPPVSAPQAPSRDAYLTAPVNARVSSEFGYRIHPIFGDRRLHAGRDYAAGCGTPVVAAADGRVVSAGWGGGYGNLVVIVHGNVGGSSLATAYAHLSSFAVDGGDVSRGQVIGYIGTTGASTGCHLHFETRTNGVAVDPRSYL